MLNRIALAAGMLLSFNLPALACGDLDAYLGDYDISVRGAPKRSGASITKEAFYNSVLKQNFTRYVIHSAPPREGLHDPALFTIYKSEKGECFAFFWDEGSLTTPEHFSDPSFVENMWKPGQSWTELKGNDRKLHTVFYPHDFMGWIKTTLRFEKGRIRIGTWEMATFFIIPVPEHETIELTAAATDR